MGYPLSGHCLEGADNNNRSKICIKYRKYGLFSISSRGLANFDPKVHFKAIMDLLLNFTLNIQLFSADTAMSRSSVFAHEKMKKTP